MTDSMQTVLESIERALTRFRPRRLPQESPPTSFVDEDGREIRIQSLREEDIEGLVRMYEAFDPTDRAQGVPPRGTDRIRDWIENLREGVNLVAVHDERVVGHVSFVPDETGSHELAIFVDQDYQHAGIGTHLLAGGLARAQECGIERVWLTVEGSNRPARRLYRRAGFATVDPKGAVLRMSRYL